jgi:hypothetical protein
MGLRLPFTEACTEASHIGTPAAYRGPSCTQRAAAKPLGPSFCAQGPALLSGLHRHLPVPFPLPFTLSHLLVAQADCKECAAVAAAAVASGGAAAAAGGADGGAGTRAAGGRNFCEHGHVRRFCCLVGIQRRRITRADVHWSGASGPGDHTHALVATVRATAASMRSSFDHGPGW